MRRASGRAVLAVTMTMGTEGMDVTMVGGGSGMYILLAILVGVAVPVAMFGLRILGIIVWQLIKEEYLYRTTGSKYGR